MGKSIGTPLTASATKVLMLGSGELGKEVVIELQRFGCEVIACDRYADAPAMQVAHRSHVFSMLDTEELRRVIELEQPDLVVPEIEAIATAALVELEAGGLHVVPTARAVNLTMNREGIRRFAAEELHLATSPYRFVDTQEELSAAVASDQLGLPAVLKPVMSSSGKGQSVIRTDDEVARAWAHAQDGGRSGQGRCIVEGFVDFDYEITVLTVSAVNGIQCCPPVGHRQVDGDYRESWQPAAMSDGAWRAAQDMARAVVEGLGGLGVFGVELFVQGDEVIFSEVSPRPHDTGLVTLGSLNMSEFALHARAILGLPVPPIVLLRPAASVPLLGHGTGVPRFEGVADALTEPDSQIRLFGKPVCEGERRLAVCVAAATTIEEARAAAARMAAAVTIDLDPR
ncbi:MAG: formate-dependent phosphoribosylglycinamide formyltransferase [Acidimicrobiales bacterium]